MNKLSIPFTLAVVCCALFGCWLDRRRGVERSWKETLANITIFLVGRVLSWTLLIVSLKWIFVRLTPGFTLPRNAFIFFLAVLATDFIFYWRHRFEHRFGILWAEHVVHHNGNELNFSTGLRLPWFTPFFGWLAVPLVMAGFPIDFIIGSMFVNLVYQYLIHNNDVPKLGFLEMILSTPSNHRVHHGHNPQYLNKNFGGIFIIWDRLFGTYEPEVEKPVFTSSLSTRSANPLWINVEPYLVYFGKRK